MKCRSIKNGCLFLFMGCLLAAVLVGVYAIVIMERGNPFRPLFWTRTEGFVFEENERCDIRYVTIKRRHQRAYKEPREVTLLEKKYTFTVADQKYYGSGETQIVSDLAWVRGRVRHRILRDGGYSIAVWYDQNDPSSSTIDEPRLGSILLPLLVPILFLPIPVLFFYLAGCCFWGNGKSEASEGNDKIENTDNQRLRNDTSVRYPKPNQRHIRKSTYRDRGANCGNCLERMMAGDWRCPVHCVVVDAESICNRYKPGLM